MNRLLWLIVTLVVCAAIAFGIHEGIRSGFLVHFDVGIELTLAAPVWLYGLSAVPLLFWATTFSLTDLSRAQHWFQSSLRALVAAAVIVALARPTSSTTSTKVAVAVLIDVSESISDKQLETAQNFAQNLAGKRSDGTKLFFISFASKARLVAMKDGKLPLDRHKGEEPGTDIPSALHLAYGLFPAGYVPHIIVLSDGNGTRGNLVAEAERAKQFGIPISWAALPERSDTEIRIESIEMPTDVRAGEPFYVRVKIWTSQPQDVTVHLSQDDFPNALEPKKEAKLPAGQTVLKFKAKAPRAGATRFMAKIGKTVKDTNNENNQAVAAVPVQGKPHILYIEGGIIRNRSSSRYLREALEAQHMDVEVRGPRSMPSSLAALQKFDLVLMSDVPAKLISLGQMAALERYVKSHGGGLIMAGGEDSFGSGGYQGTKIERLLPVRFDSEKIREKPNIAIVLVIDKSGSMNGGNIEAAKTSARMTTKVLAPHDLIAVVAHDSSAQVVVRLQRASNHGRISSDIGRLQAGGGTNIYPALNKAYSILQTADARVKHVIVLSDGRAPYHGIADICDKMHQAGITISAVGIGNADKDLLTLITEKGEGRLYMTQDISRLPRIFMNETTEAQRSALVEERIKALVVRRTDLIEGTGIERAPALRGYVSTKVKPTADLVLRTNTGEPLLASWRTGTGRAVAWTSDVKNRWAVDWLRWPGYGKFWAQLVRSSMKQKSYDSYDLATTINRDSAHVVVNALDNEDQFVNDLVTTLEVVDPATKNVIKEFPMAQTASGRYETDFTLANAGSVIVRANHFRDGRKVAVSTGAVTVPYPREYSTTESNTGNLEFLSSATGGQGPLDVKAASTIKAAKPLSFTSELWPWFMLAAGLLLILDVYSKRLRLFGYRVIQFE